MPASLPEFFAATAHPLTLESTALLREIERAAATQDSHVLMQRAGEATSSFIHQSLNNGNGNGDTVWFFAGPGNNGGDALCAAASLRRQGVDARVCLPRAPASAEGMWALQQAREAQVPIEQSSPNEADCQAAAWLVDGLFGIGLSRAIGAPFDAIARMLSAQTIAGARVLALDVPSGLDADTGNVVGDVAVEASHTLSFLAAKPGLFTGRGRDLAGLIAVASLGVDSAAFDAARAALSTVDRQAAATPKAGRDGEHHNGDAQRARRVAIDGIALNAPERFMAAFPRRRPSSHKGTFGSVAIIGGDTGTCGAVLLASRVALYCGAGRVHAVLIGDGGPAYDPPHPEIMLRRIDAIALDTMDALTIGPGLGKSARAQQVLRDAIALDLPMIIDADALNLIATHDELVAPVRAHGARIVITPHPAEAARLLHTDTAAVEANRTHAAMRLAQTYRCTVVLKGSGTLIATPDARVAINATGNAGLSTGGTGDVLSGVVGAFLAQGLTPLEAALAATYLHGAAAERLVDTGVGPAGLTAGELAPAIRTLLNALLAQFRRR